MPDEIDAATTADGHLAGGTTNDPDTSAALDKMLAEAGFSPDGQPLDERRAADEPTAEERAAAEKAEADKKAAAEKAAAEKAATPPSGQPTPDEKAAADKKAADEKAAAEAAAAKKDDLDAVELPPYTKPKTAESFAQVKTIARQKIAAVEKEREELKAKMAELEKTAKDGLPAEAKKELEELREFRAKVDVEADPKFKEYDATITSNVESIYSRLSANGFSEDSIKKIKELGGPENVNWDALADKIPASLRRYVDAKLVENEDLAEKRKKAIETAKANATEYLKSREGELSHDDAQFATKTNDEWTKTVVPKIPWLVKQEIPKDAPADKRKIAEEHNSLVDRINADLKDAMEDNTPGMKALLMGGYAISQKLQFEFELLKTTSAAKITSLEKELADAKAMIDRIKKSSSGRLASSAPITPSAKPAGKINLNETTGEALDRLRKEAEAEAEARS